MKNDKIDKEWTKNHVRTLIGEFFSNIISDMFIPKSDIIHLIKDNVDGVDSVDIYFLSERNENAIMTGSYVAKSKRYNSDKHRYELKEETVYVYPGENPGLGLDAHGNILLERNEEFPVLLGGWDFKTEHNQLVKTDALTITIE